jgi:hypothetical protein
MTREINGQDCSTNRDTIITANERAWIEFIRLISGDADPAATLARVQRLRLVFTPVRVSDLQPADMSDAE